MTDKFPTKIVLDMEQWGEHYPTGAVVYHNDEMIDSEFCDNEDEYKEFLGRYATEIRICKPEIVVHINLADIDYTTVLDCVREVQSFIDEIKRGE